MTSHDCAASRQPFARVAILIGLVFALALLGCGGSANTAPVSGKVTYKGAPVKGGTITFAPAVKGASGRSATGKVNDDGTYTLGTDQASDGALIGRHQVSYSPPVMAAPEGQKDPRWRPPVSPYQNLVARPAEVEVKAGSNTIDVELMPSGKRK